MYKNLDIHYYGKDFFLLEGTIVADSLKENPYDGSGEPERIAAYNIVARDYYANPSGNKKSQSWSEQMTGLLGKEARPHMKQFLANQGFEMK